MKLSRKQRFALAGALIAIGTCLMKGLDRLEAGHRGLGAMFLSGAALGTFVLGLRLRSLRRKGEETCSSEPTPRWMEAHRTRNLSLLGFVGAVLSLMGLAVGRQLFGNGPVSIGAQILSLALFVWARVTFGMRSFHVGANPTAGGLVTHGPYRWLRHPIYASLLWFVWSGVFAHQTALGFALGGLATVGLGVRMLLEERLLVDMYPEYSDYAKKTARVVPFLF